ncbi:MAG: hypothetical protein ACI9B9_002277 [Halioglobus sp.]
MLLLHDAAGSTQKPTNTVKLATRDFLRKVLDLQPHTLVRFLLMAALLLSTGCRVVVTGTEGGSVSRSSGGVCSLTSECQIDINDTDYDETFTAIADPGYEFSHWKKLSNSFFGNSREASINLSTARFSGLPKLLFFLDSNDIFYLEPVFVTEGSIAAVSGIARYEFPPPRNFCDGLQFTAVEVRPIRGATVEIVAENGQAILATTQTNNKGAYSAIVQSNTDVFVRVRAQLKQAGSPSWDTVIRDNAQNTNMPLSSRPQYWLDSPSFNTGTVDHNKNLKAAISKTIVSTGLQMRPASPFAILDTIYTSMKYMLTVERNLHFPPLNVFWGPANSTASGDVDLGELGGSYYQNSAIFLVGKESDDDDSFDSLVVAHEWMHYAMDKLGRSDSIGGGHGTDDLLDMRVAYDEGAATALASIVLNEKQYCDTFWFGGRLRGSGSDSESESSGPNPGWFNETSAVNLIYDLWDTNNDGVDTQSIGFASLYDVIFNKMAAAPSLGSLLTFAALVKQQPNVDTAFINSLFLQEDIDVAGINEWGDNIDNPIAGSQDIVPLYTKIDRGQTRRLCSNRQFDKSIADGNKLSEFRFLRFELNSPATVEIVASAVKPFPSGGADPDLTLFLNGSIKAVGYSGQANTETLTSSRLQPGSYVVDITDDHYYSASLAAAGVVDFFPDRICFDITLSY